MFKIITENFIPITVFPIVVDINDIVSEIKENNLDYDDIFDFISDKFKEEYNPSNFEMGRIDSFYDGEVTYQIFRINTWSKDKGRNYYDLYIKIPAEYLKMNDPNKILDKMDYTNLSYCRPF